MVVLPLLACALLIVGTAAATALWRRLDPALPEISLLERLAAGAVLGCAIWIAANWILALTGLLVPAALWVCSGLCILAALAVLLRVRGELIRALTVEYELRPLLAFTPLAGWIVYVLWRGSVLPPANHDALAYHLPKAVLMMRAEGFRIFEAPDHRITSFPFNYELLLADVLMLTRSDRLTEWIGTATFLLLLLTTAALAQRWWRPSMTSIVATVLATASAPILILHSGADKNDLMTLWLSLAALLWGSRWFAEGGRVSLLLTMIAVVLAVGTKGTAAAVGFALAPIMALRFFRELKGGRAGLRSAGGIAIAAAAIFVLCGGVPYIANYVAASTAGRSGLASGSAEAMNIQYGDWNNLWQVPYLLLTIPFSTDTNSVWIPWRQEPWFWPHFEIFFSHWGRLLSVLSLLLPIAIPGWRREGAVSERRAASIAALLAAAIMLPTQLRPLGFFGAFARYIGFLVPIIVCWTIPPLSEAAGRRWKMVPALLLAAVSVVFTLEAGICAVHDRFAPLDYALFASEHPGTRFVWFSPMRAGSIVDRIAPPDDTIGVDGAFDTWVYPAYGKDLTREVVFLPQGIDPDDIPETVDWVIIDRSWNALWSHPDFTDLGKMKYIGRGTPTPEDVHLFNALSRDPRFEIVYRLEVANQAIFRRRTAPRPPG